MDYLKNNILLKIFEKPYLTDWFYIYNLMCSVHGYAARREDIKIIMHNIKKMRYKPNMFQNNTKILPFLLERNCISYWKRCKEA